MEITEELFNWLEQTEVALSADFSNGKYILDDQTSDAFENGLNFGPLIKRLYAFSKDIDMPSELNSLKRVANAASKLYNWNVLVQALDAFGIVIDPDTKALIVAGDQEMVVEVLSQIYAQESERSGSAASQASRRGGKPNQKQARKAKLGPDGALYIETLDDQKPIEESDTCLEYLILSFVQSFGLKTKQSAGLLTQGNKYLAHIVVKGLKGDFQAVIHWYTSIFETVNRLTELMGNEMHNGALNLILPVLRPGLMARDLTVVLLACKVLKNLGIWAESAGIQDVAWDWFTREVGGMDAALFALRKYETQVKKHVLKLFLQFAKGHAHAFFSDLLPSYYPDSNLYMSTIQDFLPYFLSIRDEIVETGLVAYWVGQGIGAAENESRKNLDTRTLALNFWAELWLGFTAKIDEDEELANKILTVIKRATRDRSTILKYSAFAYLFRLLEEFSQNRNVFAPIIYKTLTFSLVENYADPPLREYILINFITIFENDPAIPISVVADPLLKQMVVAEEEGLSYNTFDFDFFICLARHDKLKLKTAIQILDLLGKVYISDYLFTRAASIPFMLITSRFIDAEPVQEFVSKFVKLGMRMIVEFERKKLPSTEKRPKYMSQSVNTGQKMTAQDLENESLAMQKRNQILDMISRLIKLWNGDVNEEIKGNLIRAYFDMQKQAKQKHYKPIVKVLGLLGDAGDLVHAYEAEHAYDSTLALTNFDSGMDFAIVPKSSSRRIYRPPPPVYGTVAEKIAEAQKKRDDMERHEREMEEMKKKEFEKQRKKVKGAIDRRKRELGVADRGTDQLIYDDVSNPVAKQKLTLCDIPSELVEDQYAITYVMKKYRRQLRELFKAYANTGYKPRSLDVKVFDVAQARKVQITAGEVYKMMRDHGVLDPMLPKKEVNQLFKLVNIRYEEPNQLSMDLDRFLELFIQLAICVYSKDYLDMRHLPKVAAVQTFIQFMITYSHRNNVNSKIWNDVYVGLGDKDVIKTLNQRLEVDPNTEMPSGYKRITQREIDLVFTPPVALNLPQSTTLVLGILDDLLNKLFRVHILEPSIVYYTNHKAVGVLVKPEAKPHITQAGYNAPSRQATPGGKAFDRQNKMHAYRLGAEVKTQVALAPLDDHDHVLETAVALEDILYSVECGSQLLMNAQDRVNGPQMNRAQILKAQQHEIALINQEKRELNRQRRRAELQEETQVIKEAREAQQQIEEQVLQKKKEREDSRRKLINAQIRKQTTTISQHGHWSSRAAPGNTSRADPGDTQQTQSGNFDRIPSPSGNYSEQDQHTFKSQFLAKKKANAQFLAAQRRKMDQKLQEQQESRQQAMIDKEHAERYQKVKQIAQREKVLQRFVEDQVKNKRTKVAEREFYQLYNQPELQAIMRKHEELVGIIFQFYSAMKGNLLDNDQPGFVFAAYNKFASDFNFWPGLFTKEDSLTIFRYYTKDSNSSFLSIEDFREALVKFAILGKNKLRVFYDEEVDTSGGMKLDPQDLQNMFAWMEISTVPKEAMKRLHFLQSYKAHPRDRITKAVNRGFRLDDMGQNILGDLAEEEDEEY